MKREKIQAHEVIDNKGTKALAGEAMIDIPESFDELQVIAKAKGDKYVLGCFVYGHRVRTQAALKAPNSEKKAREAQEKATFEQLKKYAQMNPNSDVAKNLEAAGIDFSK